MSNRGSRVLHNSSRLSSTVQGNTASGACVANTKQRRMHGSRVLRGRPGAVRPEQIVPYLVRGPPEDGLDSSSRRGKAAADPRVIRRASSRGESRSRVLRGRPGAARPQTAGPLPGERASRGRHWASSRRGKQPRTREFFAALQVAASSIKLRLLMRN